MSNKFIGIINSKIDNFTASIVVKTISQHPKYKKVMRKSRKYLVHDPKNQYIVGDTVCFQSCAPISKYKKWSILRKIEDGINKMIKG
ncbi:MAG: 30S ribosomal protein S17 [Anaplasmataceae bacterium]|nr:30S ribosomal protein S17 [Anaplasmataceae bacterium]